MISFRTQFPIGIDATINDVIKTGIEWIEKSPHSSISKRIHEIDTKSSEAELKTESESLKLAKIVNGNCHRVGFKHIDKSDSKFEFTTQIVFSKSSIAHWVSVESHVDAKVASLSIPKAKRPYILKKILADLPKGSDGEIEVDGRARNLTDQDIDFAARILNGTASFKMPVVYVSATKSGKTVINPSILSRQLFGIGHVIVEPNYEFAQRLKYSVNGSNAHAGAVGVYLPRGMGFQHLYRGDKEHEEFIEDIVDVIWDAQASVRLDKELGWSQLESDLISNKIEKLRSENNLNIDSVIVEYEGKIKFSDLLLDEAQKENDELKRRIEKLSYLSLSHTSSSGVLKVGDEDEFYDGEIVDGLLPILRRELESFPIGSRGHDILASLIEANNTIGKGIEIKDEIKRVLNSYNGMNAVTKSSLEKIGFDISDDGKHFKLVFFGDSRYTTSLAKTPSDRRNGKNSASDMIKQFIFSWNEKTAV